MHIRVIIQREGITGDNSTPVTVHISGSSAEAAVCSFESICYGGSFNNGSVESCSILTFFFGLEIQPYAGCYGNRHKNSKKRNEYDSEVPEGQTFWRNHVK